MDTGLQFWPYKRFQKSFQESLDIPYTGMVYLYIDKAGEDVEYANVLEMDAWDWITISAESGDIDCQYLSTTFIDGKAIAVFKCGDGEENMFLPAMVKTTDDGISFAKIEDEKLLGFATAYVTEWYCEDCLIVT